MLTSTPLSSFCLRGILWFKAGRSECSSDVRSAFTEYRKGVLDFTVDIRLLIHLGRYPWILIMTVEFMGVIEMIL